MVTEYSPKKLTENNTLLKYPPSAPIFPLGTGMAWRPVHTPWEVSSGPELDYEISQDSKLPVKILTAVTRNQVSVSIDGFHSDVINL